MKFMNINFSVFVQASVDVDTRDDKDKDIL